MFILKLGCRLTVCSLIEKRTCHLADSKLVTFAYLASSVILVKSIWYVRPMVQKLTSKRNQPLVLPLILRRLPLARGNFTATPHRRKNLTNNQRILSGPVRVEELTLSRRYPESSIWRDEAGLVALETQKTVVRRASIERGLVKTAKFSPHGGSSSDRSFLCCSWLLGQASCKTAIRMAR
jgi:hypothetical protein